MGAVLLYRVSIAWFDITTRRDCMRAFNGRQISLRRPDPSARAAPCRQGTDLWLGHDRGAWPARLQGERRYPLSHPARARREGISRLDGGAYRSRSTADLSRDAGTRLGARSRQAQGARTFRRAVRGRGSPVTSDLKMWREVPR